MQRNSNCRKILIKNSILYNRNGIEFVFNLYRKEQDSSANTIIIIKIETSGSKKKVI